MCNFWKIGQKCETWKVKVAIKKSTCVISFATPFRNGRQLTARALGSPDAPQSYKANSSRCLISIIEQIGHPQEAGLTIMCTNFLSE